MFVIHWRSKRADRSSGITEFPIVFAMVTTLILSSRFFHQSLNAEETSRVAPASTKPPSDLTDDIVLSKVSQGDWLVVETANFRVWSRLNSEDSIACARRCETLRQELLKKWLPEHPAFKWTPKAEVVIHRTVDEFRQTLGSQSSGASGGVNVRQEAGRIVQRRVDLRADAAGWNTSSLSHELVHLIIADHFSGRQIPRWADEGIAVLSESRAKQAEREKAIAGGASLPLSQLLRAEAYPTESLRAAFYVQSASLTDFLVSRGGCNKFLKFIEQSMKCGYECALRENYGINGVCELDREWKSRRTENSTLATR